MWVAKKGNIQQRCFLLFIKFMTTHWQDKSPFINLFVETVMLVI